MGTNPYAYRPAECAMTYATRGHAHSTILRCNGFRQRSTVTGMNLVEWLRTPHYLRTRLMMERQPIRNVEIETVFLEISHRDARLRFPVMLMLLPRRNRSPREQTPRLDQDK